VKTLVPDIIKGSGRVSRACDMHFLLLVDILLEVFCHAVVCISMAYFIIFN